MYRELIGDDAIVIDIRLRVNGELVTNFDEDVKVTIDYELPAGKDVRKLTVWYLGEDGFETFDCYYDKGSKDVSFETSHFSLYAIGFDNTISPAERNSNIFVALMLVLAVIVPIIGATVIFKKK